MVTWEDTRRFLEAVISLFAIVNPIGNLPIFVGLTPDVSDADRRKLLRLAGVVGLVIVAILGVAGRFLLSGVFHVSLDEFMFGGGVLLMVIGVRNIIASRSESPAPRPGSPGETWRRRVQVAVSPIAIPLLVGPGSIATAMLVVNQHGAVFGLAACVVTFAMVILVMHYSQWIFRVIGEIGTLAIGRVMQIFIVAIGAHFVLQSIRTLFFCK